MDIQKARELEPVEITKLVKDGDDTMFRLKFQMTMGQTDGVKKYRLLRKDKARMLTVQRERELEAQQTAKGKK
jgi:large subunit ribosomal protein L29